MFDAFEHGWWRICTSLIRNFSWYGPQKAVTYPALRADILKDIIFRAEAWSSWLTHPQPFLLSGPVSVDRAAFSLCLPAHSVLRVDNKENSTCP